MASKVIISSIIILLVLVVGIIVFVQFSSQGTDTGSSQGEQTPPSLGNEEESQPPPSGETTPIVQQPSVKEFLIEADDRGFYMNGADISSISAGSGEALKITFNVRTQNVYYGGLDFRGCGQDTEKVSPGGSTMVKFTATSTCTITSYWPSSSRVKDTLQVSVA